MFVRSSSVLCSVDLLFSLFLVVRSLVSLFVRSWPLCPVAFVNFLDHVFCRSLVHSAGQVVPFGCVAVGLFLRSFVHLIACLSSF